MVRSRWRRSGGGGSGGGGSGTNSRAKRHRVTLHSRHGGVWHSADPGSRRRRVVQRPSCDTCRRTTWRRYGVRWGSTGKYFGVCVRSVRRRVVRRRWHRVRSRAAARLHFTDWWGGVSSVSAAARCGQQQQHTDNKYTRTARTVWRQYGTAHTHDAHTTHTQPQQHHNHDILSADTLYIPLFTETPHSAAAHGTHTSTKHIQPSHKPTTDNHGRSVTFRRHETRLKPPPLQCRGSRTRHTRH